MISFYHIRGISLTDTPFFETLEQQQLFFQEYKVFDYGDAYMPPHFTNELVVYSEELDYENGMDFNTKINYLSLEYLNKTYYYFISDIKYEGEGSMRLYLTMDTIQTYMFNIKYTNARIERRTIRRWNKDGTINRDYIRENLSNEIFTNLKYFNLTEHYQKDNFCGWFIIKHLKKGDAYDANRTTVYYNDIDGGRNDKEQYTEGSSIMLFPSLHYNLSQSKYQELGGFPVYLVFNKESSTYENKYTTGGGLIDWALNQQQNDPKTIEMYYVGYNIFDDITTKYEIHDIDVPLGTVVKNARCYTVTLPKDTEENKIKRVSVAEPSPNVNLPAVSLDVFKCKISTKNYTYNFNFRPPIIYGELFDKHHIPQLLDENYYQINFGERQDYTSYPLSKMAQTTLHCKHNFDLFSGSRFYWFETDTDTEDKYLTRITVDKRDDVLMFNDVWKQYVASNKGTMAIKDTMALFNSLKSPIKTFSGVKVKTKKGDLTKSFKSRVNKFSKNYLSSSEGNGLISLISERQNLINAPRTLKQGNTYTDVSYGKGSDIIFTINECSNINDVATIYESIGFRVDQFIEGAPIFKDRQIYNFVKCHEINLDLDILSTSEIIEDIENRYLDGIRYWNTNSLKLLSLELGEVCKYDNIETE